MRLLRRVGHEVVECLQLLGVAIYLAIVLALAGIGFVLITIWFAVFDAYYYDKEAEAYD